ncbi:MAG: glycosyltransferase family 4 protein [Acetobacteraceae bacterium]
MSAPGDARPSLLAVATLPPWPTTNGYALRVGHLLEELARDWSITLVAPASDQMPPQITRHVPVTLPARGVTYPWRYDQTTLAAALAHALATRRHDCALVWAGAEALWFGRRDLPPAVVDAIDCNPLEFWRGALSYRDLRQRLRALREIPVASRYTRRMVRSFAATVCVGEADARWLRRIGGRDTVYAVPNGVDLPPPAAIAAEAAAPVLSFTGTLDYQPNIEAARYAVAMVWPRVLAAVPSARFRIAGRHPVPEVLALAGHSGVEIVPDVPDMRQEIGRGWVSIAPMRSGVGIKNKVLEAWACGRPVVLTRLATNGLVVPPDHAGLVADDAGAMAAAVVALFHDAARRAHLGASARANVAAHFTWAGSAARVAALLRAVSGPVSRSP